LLATGELSVEKNLYAAHNLEASRELSDEKNLYAAHNLEASHLIENIRQAKHFMPYDNETDMSLLIVKASLFDGMLFHFTR